MISVNKQAEKELDIMIKMKRIIKSMENKYFLPSLDLIEDVFTKWDSPEEGKAVRQLVEEIRVKKYYIPELQRQHISKDILEYGFDIAKSMGFKAILVEGNPRNYNNRGFQPSYKFGIEAGPNIKLPHPDCLMVKELEAGALDKISGLVDYAFYETLRKE